MNKPNYLKLKIPRTMTSNIRSGRSGDCAILKHFDNSQNNRLAPYPRTLNKETKAYNIIKFLYAPWLSAGASRLYGFGVVSGTNTPKIFTFDIDSLDMTDTWEEPAKGEGNTGTRFTEAFFYYKNYIYGWTGDKLWRFDTTGSDDFNNVYYAGNADTVAQPVHHPADDVAYFFHNNFVSKLDNETWGEKVLTLPDDLKIVSGTHFGDYLAIACISKSSFGNRNIVFLWDRDESLTTITGKINVGDGTIRHIYNLNGELFAVMDFYNGNSGSVDKPEIVIKRITFSGAYEIARFQGDNSTGYTHNFKGFYSDAEKAYFNAAIDLEGETIYGIWSVDRNGNLLLEIVEEEDSDGSYQGIFRVGKIWWIAHSGDGSVNYLDITGTYSTTLASEWRTIIIDNEDASAEKKLIGVNVTTEPMPENGQVVIKYRKDEESTWTTIFTHTTDDSLEHSAINIESTGATLPEYKEIQFKIESTGGAVITGFKMKYELLDKNLF